MGYIGDLHYDIALLQSIEEQNFISETLDNCDNDKLYELTKIFEEDLVVNIRNYYKKYNKLSDKQRYCLARRICEEI